MLKATIVTGADELRQILGLNQRNLKSNLDPDTQATEGFVTWLYPLELLEKMHALAPSIIVKDGPTIAGYALTTLRASKHFHADLDAMFRNLEKVLYKNRLLSSFHFYCMGQICVAKEYRGQGVVKMLYEKHKEVYGAQYDFVLTEIATRNVRSMRAHEKIGFQTIYTYQDAIEAWNVVVWEFGL